MKKRSVVIVRSSVIAVCIVLSSCRGPAEKVADKAAPAAIEDRQQVQKAHSKPTPLSIADWDGLAYKSQVGFSGFVGQAEKVLWVRKGERGTNEHQFHGQRYGSGAEDIAIRVKRILWKNEGERKNRGLAKIFKVKPEVVHFAWMKLGALLQYTLYTGYKQEPPAWLPARKLEIGKSYLFVTTHRYYGHYFLKNCAKKIPVGSHARIEGFK